MSDTIGEAGAKVLRNRYSERFNIGDVNEELHRQEDRKVDIVQNTRVIDVNPTRKGIEKSGSEIGNIFSYEDPSRFRSTNNLPISLSLRNERISNIGINRHALSQICSAVKVPIRSMDHLLETDPELAALVIERGLASLGKLKLFRFLDEENRAFLSDRYMILDNLMLFNFLTNVMMGNDGWYPHEFSFTQTKFYVHFLNSSISEDVGLGDTVVIGIKITNSEVGCGSVSVEYQLYRLACLNLMVVPTSKVKKVHLGAQHDEGLISSRTIQLRHGAMMSEVKDAIELANNPELFAEMVTPAKLSARTELADPHATVRYISNEIGLSEREEVETIGNMVRGSDNSLWGALNAVTATARETEDYDRKSQLEASAGNILANQRAWSKLSSVTTDDIKPKRRRKNASN